MKSAGSITVICFVAFLAVGCASTTYDTNNNSPPLNNNNPGIDGGSNTNNTSGCATTCAAPGVCVGQPEHQTCVSACESGLTCADTLRTCCYGGCVDLMNDPNNCGSCASYCDGNCINGTCVDQCSNMCSTGQDCCGGTCVDIQSDMNNCGACTSVCDSDESNACVGGYCKCGTSPPCNPGNGQECCGTSCKTLSSDVTNCGGCGIACSIGESCNSGSCQCGTGGPCMPSQGCCSGGCVDMNTNQNCGSCGFTCDNGDTCFSGTCGCGSAGTVCEGLLPGTPGECCGTSGCVVFVGLMVENCGACGVSCAGFCIGGACQ